MHATLFGVGLQKNKIPPHHRTFRALLINNVIPYALGCVFRQFFWGNTHFLSLYGCSSTNKRPRLAAGMALFQPRDWFSVAQLSLSLAIRIVRQKMDECNLSKSISTMFHISIEEKLFLHCYRYIARPYFIHTFTSVTSEANSNNMHHPNTLDLQLQSQWWCYHFVPGGTHNNQGKAALLLCSSSSLQSWKTGCFCYMSVCGWHGLSGLSEVHY